jgi:hypothetical protein
MLAKQVSSTRLIMILHSIPASAAWRRVCILMRGTLHLNSKVASVATFFIALFFFKSKKHTVAIATIIGDFSCHSFSKRILYTPHRYNRL